MGWKRLLNCIFTVVKENLKLTLITSVTTEYAELANITTF